MKAEIAHARLAEVPNEVRDQMMRHRAVLPAGAIAVVARGTCLRPIARELLRGLR